MAPSELNSIALLQMYSHFSAGVVQLGLLDLEAWNLQNGHTVPGARELNVMKSNDSTYRFLMPRRKTANFEWSKREAAWLGKCDVTS